MGEIIVKDAALRAAASEGIDAFLDLIINSINEAIGGELNSETMSLLNSDQITLLAYDIVHKEVMDGGFVQLIHNGYGPFIYDNPFARAIKGWGLREFSKLVYATSALYRKHGESISADCSDDEFMALFEQYPEFDDFDDMFVENEEDWTYQIASYVDENIGKFIKIEE